jgi:hypothetical protein
MVVRRKASSGHASACREGRGADPALEPVGEPGGCLGAEMPESGTPGRLDHVPKNEARGGILSGRVGSPSVGPVGWNEILPPPGAFLLPTGPLPVRAAGIGRGTFSVQVTR